MAVKKKQDDVRYDLGDKFVRTSCELCSTCWRHEDNDVCIYGGPFKAVIDAKYHNPGEDYKPCRNRASRKSV